MIRKTGFHHLGAPASPPARWQPAGEDAGAPRTFQFNCGGRGAKILKEKPSAVTLPLVTEK